MLADTIAALASPPGPAARAVLRLSGSRAGAILRECWRGPGALELGSRACLRGLVHDGRGTQPALVLWMPGPASFTREDVCELHVPGSPFLVDALLARLLALGARLAEPGEFTRRAFLSGRIDLAQAQAVLALVRARSEDERRAASARLFGGLERRLDAFAHELGEARALCEASLDFEEGDTGHVPLEELLERVRAARAELDAAAREEAVRPLPDAAPRVVLAGRPNAGKSRLFNALVEEPRALVSALAGTTRDALVGSWRVASPAGARVLELRDTAGLDDERALAEAPDGDALLALERRAQERTRAELEAADLVVWVVDSSRAPSVDALEGELARLPAATPRLVAWAQQDRAASAPPPERLGGVRVLGLSAAAGEGLEELGSAALAALAEGEAAAGGARELGLRHRDALRRGLGWLDEALAALESGAPLDQVGSLLRDASDALGAIDGRESPEELLGRIFARFCIGK